MPIPILLHAGAARITGEYLIAGKIVGYLTVVALLIGIFVVLRRLACPVPVALALSAITVVTNSGFIAATRIQGDALPVVLQLAAVTRVAWHSSRRSAIEAAALSVLAVLSKVSAVWAPLGISLWLLLRDRRRLLPYVASFVALLAVSLAAFQMASQGRMLENLRGLTFAGVSGVGALRQSPINLVWQLASFATATWALVPLAVVGAAASVGRRDAEIFYICLLCETAIMLVVVADEGVTQNHLIDLVVLVVVAAGGVWRRMDDGSAPLSIAAATMAVTVFWVGSASFLLNLYPEAKHAVKSFMLGRADAELVANPMAGHIAPSETLLSEDPYVPVSLGQLPVVLDAWMLLRLGRRHPEWTDHLATRIEAREFTKIVLTRPFEGNEDWYRTVQFGPAVARAIGHSYRQAESVANYYVYVPTGPR
jgi:hypothetical protein